MYHRLLYLFFLLLAGSGSIAQILPDSGSKINYTQVMFEHPPVRGATEYMLEVTLKEDTAFKNPVVSRTDSSCAAIVSGLDWGQKYMWRYVGMRNRELLSSHGPYGFETMTSMYTNQKRYRVRVRENDSIAHAGGLITVDQLRTVVDRHGRCVWFLPPDSGGAGPNAQNHTDPTPTDIRITPQGSITLIAGARAEEIDLRKNLLWLAPKRTTFGIDSFSEHHPYHYHHCFKKLANGNYMVLDMQNIVKTVSHTDKGKVMMAYEVIRELDRAGHLVWSWNSENYFNQDELKAMALGKPDSSLINQEPGGHMNGFDIDEKNGFVYAGFRNMSRVVKIDKLSGRVLCAWGANMKYNGVGNGNGFFFKQHDVALLRDGSIAVFNNNVATDNPDMAENHSSGVVVFTEPSETATSTAIWKYQCAFDSGSNLSPRGGGVEELKNGDLLVCMGTVNRIFEINRDKKIVWSSTAEQWDWRDSVWRPVDLYRVHNFSSLYPCYFTVQTGSDTIDKTSSALQLRIFNDGTESDSYTVNITSAARAYNKHFSTDIVPGGRSIGFEMAPLSLPVSDDRIEIAVRSKTNPDFKRTVYVQFSVAVPK